MASNIHNSFINKNEAEALKEMIFERVRARAEAVNAAIDADYTSTVKADIMDMARKSFVAEKNPFSESKNMIQKTHETPQLNTHNEVVHDKLNELPTKEPVKLKSVDNDYAKAQILENMNTAYNELSTKKGFIGALNFLNSQATNSLFKTKDNSLNMLA